MEEKMEQQSTQDRLPDPDEMYVHLENRLRALGHSLDLDRIRAAYEMAKRGHEGQKRKDGSPYLTHCVATAEIAVDFGLDEDSIVAALLHDTIEDTGITHEEIEHRFGSAVADIVDGVTKLTRVQYTSKEDEQMENLRKMLMAMAKDIRVILIKAQHAHHGLPVPGKAAQQVAGDDGDLRAAGPPSGHAARQVGAGGPGAAVPGS